MVGDDAGRGCLPNPGRPRKQVGVRSRLFLVERALECGDYRLVPYDLGKGCRPIFGHKRQMFSHSVTLRKAVISAPMLCIAAIC